MENKVLQCITLSLVDNHLSVEVDSNCSKALVMHLVQCADCYFESLDTDFIMEVLKDEL